MYYGWNDNRTDNERYLEDQLEQERQQRREEQEQRQRAREQRMEEYHEQHEHWMRSADGWPEAIDKQIALMSRESWGEGLSWISYPTFLHDMYFTESVAACRRALQIWKDEEAKVADEVAALEQRITELKNGIRFNVGERLEREKYYKSPGWQGVVNTLNDEDSDPAAWLNW